jgi:hypothetical protein
LWLGGIATVILALGVTAVIVYGYAAKPGWVGVSNKTVWDYLELLIVPAALAIGVAWLNWMQSKRATREAQEAQRERTRNEDKQHRRDLLITSQRAQVEALQAYLGHISEMLMDESLDKRLRDVTDSAGNNLRVLARARTLTVLSQLEDGHRKGSVLQFLYEANLITWGHKSRNDELAVLSAGPETGSTGVVDLSGADLGHAELNNAFLTQATLGSRYEAPGVYLWHANLRGARLGQALLYRANLSYATLSDAHLAYADLTEVTATGSNFSGADLIGANLTRVDLSHADLSHANLSSVFKYTENGSSRQLVTNEELEHQASSLEGTIMPNRQTFEDWIKDKKIRGEQGENGGPS